MKLSLNWIKDYVNIPADWEMSRIAYDLTMSTVEVEGYTDLGKKFDKMVIGLIKEVLPHPNADKLKVCVTDLGVLGTREIVCGGSNVKNDMKVAVACPGSFVKWHGEGELVEIKATKLRGVDSFGMICAAEEIGLGDLFEKSSEAEIVDFSNLTAEAGTPIAKALGLDDIILEIDNKSLTNRPDLWGHYGIARELSALYNLPLKKIDNFVLPEVETLEVEIDNKQLCKRYIGTKIEGVYNTTSPLEIQTRLWRVGMRPINALVDITNYIMLSTGQPTHAFDADNVEGKVIVRNAVNEEDFLALNGKTLKLSSKDLVIADNKGVIGLAGIIGGEKDSVNKLTNKVILEIANFDALTIRATATKHEVRTESSMRNEKGLDAERCEVTLALALNLFKQIFPEMKITAFVDKFVNKAEKKTIKVSLNWLLKRLGKDLDRLEIENKLSLLGFSVSVLGDDLELVVPSWRATGDVSITDDILEEVARMHGFENFEAKPITSTFFGAINQIEVNLDRKIREYFAFRCGMSEIYSYPWINDEYIKAVLGSAEGMLALSAPPSPNEKYIRSSLLPNLCKAVYKNLRYFDSFNIFESAQVFFDKEFKSNYDEKELLPKMQRNVAGAGVSTVEKVTQLYREVKGYLTNLPKVLHAHPFTFDQREKPYWADNVAWVNIIHLNKIIGAMGIMSTKTALDCGIKNSAVVLFEFNIDEVKTFTSRTNKFTHVAEYPLTHRDLSVLVEASVRWEQIEKIINSNMKNNKNLQQVMFVDEYKGKQVPDGLKSVTLKLVIGSSEKTLTSLEIDTCANAVNEVLKHNFSAKLR